MHLLRKAVGIWRERGAVPGTMPVAWYGGRAYIGDPSPEWGVDPEHLANAVALLNGVPRESVKMGVVLEIAFDGEVIGAAFGLGTEVGVRLEAKDIIWLG